MIPTRRFFMVAAAILVICNTGCVHPLTSGSATNGSIFAVSLPPLKLAPGEYIQSINVDVTRGRIVTINRTWDDWDIGLDWDNPSNLALTCSARHFVSGFAGTQEFDRFITVQAGPQLFDIKATISTASTDKSGQGEREFHISRSELILTPAPRIAVWR